MNKGTYYEELACQFLEKHGLILLTQLPPVVVTDLIMPGTTLVFVEVKYRSTSTYGNRWNSYRANKSESNVPPYSIWPRRTAVMMLCALMYRHHSNGTIHEIPLGEGSIRMKPGQLLISIFLIVTLITVPTAAAQDVPTFDVDAAAAVLLDYDTGQILYSKNGSEERIPASLVKVMTMFIAMDHLKSGRISLQDTTRVSENAWRMTGSQMFLEVGETVTIEQLLYGIAVVSGNDACVALAEALAGSEVFNSG